MWQQLQDTGGKNFMNKISNAFNNGKALIGFITVGDPSLKTSEEVILKMVQGGCDLIEVEIPFSDPVAEGAVIQSANVRAINNGTTTDKVFELVNNVSQQADVPFVLMAYLNVLFKYGYDKFLEKAKQCGVSGVLVPDLPYEEKAELESVAEKYEITVLSFAAPATNKRIKNIAAAAKGFISAMSTMGYRSKDRSVISSSSDIVECVKDVTNVPVVIAAGVETPEDAKEYTAYADGVVINSAIIELIEKHGENAPEAVYNYVKSIKNAI